MPRNYKKAVGDCQEFATRMQNKHLHEALCSLPAERPYPPYGCGRCASQRPRMTQIKPAMNNMEIGSARMNAPNAAEVIGLSERNTVT